MEAVYNVRYRFLINLRPGHAISILWAQRLESGVLTENSSGSIITGETGLAHTRTDIKLAIMDRLTSLNTNSKTKHSQASMSRPVSGIGRCGGRSGPGAERRGEIVQRSVRQAGELTHCR